MVSHCTGCQNYVHSGAQRDEVQRKLRFSSYKCKLESRELLFDCVLDAFQSMEIVYGLLVSVIAEN
jgi:hypothetical protein